MSSERALSVWCAGQGSGERSDFTKMFDSDQLIGMLTIQPKFELTENFTDVASHMRRYVIIIGRGKPQCLADPKREAFG